MTPGVSLLGTLFFTRTLSWMGARLTDVLCGTKLFARHEYERFRRWRDDFGDFDPFGDFDLIFGAARLGLKITEIPVRYRDRSYGETNISRWKHGLLLLRMSAIAARKIKFV